VNGPIRTAFFPDTYLEVNGAAKTCQRLADYARRHDNPYLVVHAAKTSRAWEDGSVRYLSLKRSPVSFLLDEELAYDPLFQRHTRRVLRALLDFNPDVIHITGLNDVGIMGSYLAWKLQIPLIGSWHTNIHEFAAERMRRMLRFLPEKTLGGITGFAEKQILKGTVLYYKMPKVVLAPNRELVDLLGQGTHRTAMLMERGVDAEKFSPDKRTADDGIFRFGFVGRLRPEKNVRLLIDLEKKLLAAGKTGFEFLIVGEGNEREELMKKMKHAKFTGFIDGAELAEAYANMDVFVFPSETDAYGNVIQEAAASGVPSIVTDKGGPKYLVADGETGFIAKDPDQFVDFALLLMDDPERMEAMRRKARERALSISWDAVFAGVFDAYRETLKIAIERKRASSNGFKN
jgi:glycosyltransferase involved in cell wall biosynthesis